MLQHNKGKLWVKPIRLYQQKKALIIDTYTTLQKRNIIHTKMDDHLSEIDCYQYNKVLNNSKGTLEGL